MSCSESVSFYLLRVTKPLQSQTCHTLWVCCHSVVQHSHICTFAISNHAPKTQTEYWKRDYTLWTHRDNSSYFAGPHHIQMTKAHKGARWSPAGYTCTRSPCTHICICRCRKIFFFNTTRLFLSSLLQVLPRRLGIFLSPWCNYNPKCELMIL